MEKKRFDIATIREWAEGGGSLGVRTGKQSSVFVLDVDVHSEDANGFKTLDAFVAEHGPLPETYTVRTAGGGKHLYFRLPEFEVTSGTNVLGAGLDIKGERSFVVAPGSIRQNGGRYEVESDAPIAFAPDWLLDMLRPRAERKVERVREITSDVQKVPTSAPCCEGFAERAVRSVEAKMRKLADAPPRAKVKIGGKPRGWDDGYHLLAMRLIEIASWPYTSFALDDAERVFFENAPDAEGRYDPAHKWERGLIDACGWITGNTHRIEEHGPSVLDKATLRVLTRDEQKAREEFLDSLALTRAKSTPEDRFEADVAEQARRLKVLDEAKRRHAEEQSDPAGWEPVDLTEALSAGPVLPDVGTRTDGVGVFYSLKLNVVFGESEGGKTWLALHIAKQVMAEGAADDPRGHVVYLDYEDDDRSIAQRLVSTNVPDHMILEQFHYVNPPGPFTDRVFEQLKRLFENARLVVIDATTEALAREGLDSNSDTDIAAFYNRYPKRIAALGPAVVVIDHVTKAQDGRGQQIGSQMKKAGVDGVAYNVTPVDRFTKGQGGTAMVLIGKDKQGGVREHGVFGGEGKPDRFGFFTMDGSGCTALHTVRAAESKIERQMKKGAEVIDAIREHLAESPESSANHVLRALREQGLKFDDKAARGWVREVKEAQK